MTVHEYFHAMMSLLFDEYDKIELHWYGPEAIFITPVEERTPGIKWFFISGISNFVTLAIGYMVFLLRGKIINLRSTLIKNFLYYIGVVFLLFDAVNLSIGPFIFGVDTAGIAAGLNIQLWIIQIIFGLILLINRELIVSFMKSFGIISRNIIFRSWYRK
jgi:small-conductance mechanosensitive channel